MADGAAPGPAAERLICATDLTHRVAGERQVQYAAHEVRLTRRCLLENA